MEQEIEMRKAQEGLANFINFGMHKEMAKINKAIYDAHIKVGFDEKQALEIVKAITKGGKINS